MGNERVDKGISEHVYQFCEEGEGVVGHFIT